MRFVLALMALALAAPAQDRDFLTADEADQVREAQEPNARLQLYVKFAQERLELLKQLMTSTKPGRTLLIHDTLEDYTHIIEAIDTVADDALKRKADIAVGMKAVAEGEKQMAETLNKMNENPGKDFARYEFAMQQAMETTQDSLDLSNENLNTRAGQVEAKEKKEKAEREAMMSEGEVKEKKAAEKKTEQTKRKVPTLRRPGEVKDPPKQ
ncbi:MAG: hypothetical protein JSU00_20465 [Acidobacteria bacterium]|nr:hypothetical protein [Acidobacteriota bacterium]